MSGEVLEESEGRVEDREALKVHQDEVVLAVGTC
jgi:hypothetical protein